MDEVSGARGKSAVGVPGAVLIWNPGFAFLFFCFHFAFLWKEVTPGMENPEDQEPVSPRRHCGETVTMTARVDGMPQWQGLSPLPRRKPWQFLAKGL